MSPAFVGVVLACDPMGSMMSAGPTVAIISRLGPRNAALWGMVFNSVSSVIFGFAPKVIAGLRVAVWCLLDLLCLPPLTTHRQMRTHAHHLTPCGMHYRHALGFGFGFGFGFAANRTIRTGEPTGPANLAPPETKPARAGITHHAIKVLAGVLSNYPLSAVFVLTRLCNGFATAITYVSIFVVLGEAFPAAVGKISADLSAISTVGMILGPPLGGVLFTAGDEVPIIGAFAMPFLVFSVRVTPAAILLEVGLTYRPPARPPARLPICLPTYLPACLPASLPLPGDHHGRPLPAGAAVPARRADEGRRPGGGAEDLDGRDEADGGALQ
jgi:MFS family permease